MKCLFAAGGTGGHIQPALALAAEMREVSPGCEILFAGGHRPQERAWVTSAGHDFRPIRSCPFTGPAHEKALALLRTARGVSEGVRLVRAFRPDVIVGFGGYASLPLILAGCLLGRPRVLLEQNVLPGRTNRLLARLATEVHSQWEEARPHFGRRVVFRHSGNPVRPAIRRAVSSAVAGRSALLVMGGSQGSEAVNRLMLEASPVLGARRPGLEVLHLAGPSGVQELRAAYARAGLRAEVHAYREDMEAVYARAGLAVCRAGGTTIAELMVAGIPALLIPYPHAADDHQTRNAEAVEVRGGGLCLPERALTGEALASYLLGFLGDPGRLSAFQAGTRALAMPEAGRRIADRLVELAGRRQGAASACGPSARETLSECPAGLKFQPTGGMVRP
ncbi:MAG: undecaprenyldiphospho-muramoylpentapeptide beta-N-acetylglucosaminyltransferase [Planctomycetes bacterium]|nr:undecaprenyldiphospho-muramoylpentapeptide beta-N-acetylglucosaminyltransferase [Planctomycetota bacterium]